MEQLGGRFFVQLNQFTCLDDDMFGLISWFLIQIITVYYRISVLMSQLVLLSFYVAFQHHNGLSLYINVSDVIPCILVDSYQESEHSAFINSEENAERPVYSQHTLLNSCSSSIPADIGIGAHYLNITAFAEIVQYVEKHQTLETGSVLLIHTGRLLSAARVCSMMCGHFEWLWEVIAGLRSSC